SSVTLVSRNSSGDVANGDSYDAALSADFSHVAFYSNADNLAADVGREGNIFRHALATEVTTHVSGQLGGDAGNEASGRSSISDDGRYVAFESDAYNFVDGANSTQIYVRDALLGTIELVSTTAVGVAANGSSTNPIISTNGRAVAFVSEASNLIANVSGEQIYLKDLDTGSVTLISANSSGVAADGSSRTPAMSNDGQRIVFASNATNLVAGVTGWQIYLKHLSSGEIQLASSDRFNTAGNGASLEPAISGDGLIVAFSSTATNFVQATSGQQVYLKDLQTDMISAGSTNDAGRSGDGPSSLPSLDIDGRHVGFTSTSTNLVQGVSGTQVYVKDTQGLIRAASTNNIGQPGNDVSDDSHISDDARYVIFTTTSTNFEIGISGKQIVRKQLESGELTRVCESISGQAANAECTAPTASSNGRHITFTSAAVNLVAGVKGVQIYNRDMGN
ncbi:MAG: TolB family protein, partial [Bradymonadaceae bacterium]